MSAGLSRLEDDLSGRGSTIAGAGAGGGKLVGGGAGGGRVDDARGRRPAGTVVEARFDELGRVASCTTGLLVDAYGCTPGLGLGTPLIGRPADVDNAVPITSAPSISSSASLSALAVSDECRGSSRLGRCNNDGMAELGSDISEEGEVEDGVDGRVELLDAEMDEEVYVDGGECGGSGILYIRLKIFIRSAYVSCCERKGSTYRVSVQPFRG